MTEDERKKRLLGAAAELGISADDKTDLELQRDVYRELKRRAPNLGRRVTVEMGSWGL